MHVNRRPRAAGALDNKNTDREVGCCQLAHASPVTVGGERNLGAGVPEVRTLCRYRAVVQDRRFGADRCTLTARSAWSSR